MEDISGQKYETTWLGKDNSVIDEHRLEMNENGEYAVLVEIEEEMARIRTSKEN